jgi:hypothetical protein
MATRQNPETIVKLVGEGPDWLSSVASIVGAIAWPAVIITCLVLFRSEIRAILSRVTSIGIGSVTAQVDQSLRATEVLSAATALEGAGGEELLEQQASVATPSSEVASTVRGGPNSSSEEPEAVESARRRNIDATVRAPRRDDAVKSYEEWASRAHSERSTPIAPRMIKAFEPVEELIRVLASRFGVPNDLSIEDTIMALSGMEVISGSYGSLLGSQANLRNIVAQTQGVGISEFQARQYIEQLGETRRRLEELLARSKA